MQGGQEEAEAIGGHNFLEIVQREGEDSQGGSPWSAHALRKRTLGRD